ncbi:MAG: hypothetical protein LBT82_00265 [Oscillospiraceae bacterium]|jgi:hypothetical protein|nr:hypothetical protein [Oscillospiraceae bacterium]
MLKTYQIVENYVKSAEIYQQVFNIPPTLSTALLKTKKLSTNSQHISTDFQQEFLSTRPEFMWRLRTFQQINNPYYYY